MAEGIQRRTFEWRQARVTALLVAGLLVLGYGVARVGAIFDVFADRYELVTLVPSALGLREGAPVTLAGQRIGQVSTIEFIPVRAKRGANNLLVRIAISERVRDQVRADSRAFLRTQGLLGDKFVDIEPGSVTAQVLGPGDTLATGPSVDMDEVIAQAAAALNQAGSIVTDLRAITRGVARGQGTIGRFLADDQLYDRMLGATAALQGTLAQVNRADVPWAHSRRSTAPMALSGAWCVIRSSTVAFRAPSAAWTRSAASSWPGAGAWVACCTTTSCSAASPAPPPVRTVP